MKEKLIFLRRAPKVSTTVFVRVYARGTTVCMYVLRISYISKSSEDFVTRYLFSSEDDLHIFPISLLRLIKQDKKSTRL